MGGKIRVVSNYFVLHCTYQVMSKEAALLNYCRSREILKRRERETKESRAEQADAERTLGGLLAESMQRNALECMPAPGGEGFVRLSAPSTRPCKLSTEEDVLSLLDGIDRALTDVPAEKLPTVIVRVVQERARDRARNQRPQQALPLRVKMVKAPTGPVHHGPLPPETRTLATQYTTAVQERRGALATMKPLRTAYRAAEAVLKPVLEGTESVRMEVDGTSKVLQVCKVERPPPGSSSRSSSGRALGIRRVLKLLREAADEVCGEKREELLPKLRESLLLKIRADPLPSPEPVQSIKVVARAAV